MGRSILEQKVPKIAVRWRIKYQNSHKCKQTAAKCKQTAEICKQTAVKNVNNQLFWGASFLDAIYRTKLS